jgi:hypothetical protein
MSRTGCFSLTLDDDFILFDLKKNEKITSKMKIKTTCISKIEYFIDNFYIKKTLNFQNLNSKK